ncbi:helix-hairpin-helix domain-containing protein [Nocardia asteroides]
MSRQDERERVRRRLGELTARVGASRTAGVGSVPAEPGAEREPSGRATAPFLHGEREREARGPYRTASGAAIATTPPEERSSADGRPLLSGAGHPRSAASRMKGTPRAARASGGSGSAFPDDGASEDFRADVSGETEEGRTRELSSSDGAARVEKTWADERSPGAGKWNLSRLTGEQAPDRVGADDVGRVRSPGWLEEPATGPGLRHRLVPERFRGIRLDPGRRGVRTLGLVGLAAMVIAGVIVFRERPIAHPVPPLPVRQTAALQAPDAVAPVSEVRGPRQRVDPGPPPVELVVSVVGLVQRTGLVRLPEGSRVADALAAAGGTSEGADTSGLNLAQRLSDGDQVLVGPVVSSSDAPQQGSGTIGAGGRPSSGSAAAPSRPSVPSGRVDLNTASEAELDALPGVGPVTARAIVSWRAANGRFTSVEQLGEVDGIGPARLARLRDLVRV